MSLGLSLSGGALLYLFVDRTFAGAPEVSSEAESWLGVDFEALPEVRLLQRYVAIDTSWPDGDELAGVRFLQELLAGEGIASEVEYLGRGRANLWAVLEGRERGAVVLHHHVDVEPARPSDGWRDAPFAGTIEGPWIFGRGVYDMKSLAVAQLQAFVAVKRSGVIPRRSLILLATSSEETGSDVGTKWILRQHPELVERMELFLTEGGVVEAVSPREVKYWGIEFAQKHFADLVFCAAGRERLEELSADLAVESRRRAPVRLDPAVLEFVAPYGPSRDHPSLKRILGRPAVLLERSRDVQRLTPFLRALFHNSLSAFPIREAVGGGFELPVKVQALPGSTLEEALADTLPPGLGAGLSRILRPLGGAGAVSPIDHPAFRALAEEVAVSHPGVRVGPYLLPWSASDARFLRAAGIPAYGFSPFLLVAADTFTVAEPNERMALSAFVDGVALYERAVRRLVE
ncbi:MAG TPA: M20/M25/M40 family metallo-hydrolase [Thermoanaerobaculia bacterium]|nr:M20/M25/M40 family metallo-hydrolase [Thermoanaerobaculia bacterium]